MAPQPRTPGFWRGAFVGLLFAAGVGLALAWAFPPVPPTPPQVTPEPPQAPLQPEAVVEPAPPVSEAPAIAGAPEPAGTASSGPGSPSPKTSP